MAIMVVDFRCSPSRYLGGNRIGLFSAEARSIPNVKRNSIAGKESRD